MSSYLARRRTVASAAALLLATLPGCPSMRAAEARDAHLKETMGAYTYRAEGTVAGGGCRVIFTREAQPDTDDPSKTTSWADWEMALSLLRRVDPAEAKRIEAGV